MENVFTFNVKETMEGFISMDLYHKFKLAEHFICETHRNKRKSSENYIFGIRWQVCRK